MLEGRTFGAGAVVNFVFGMVIGGSTSPTGSIGLNTVAAYNQSSWSNSMFSSFPHLTLGHCAVMIDSFTVMIMGGILDGGTGPHQTTWIFNGQANSWVQGPNMTLDNYGQACTFWKYYNSTTGTYQSIIIAAGGAANPSTQILNYDLYKSSGAGFFRGPNLPVQLTNAAMVTNGFSVFLIGGLDNSQVDQSGIYQMQSPYGGWTTLTQSLKVPRSSVLAFPVIDCMVDCQIS